MIRSYPVIKAALCLLFAILLSAKTLAILRGSSTSPPKPASVDEKVGGARFRGVPDNIDEEEDDDEDDEDDEEEEEDDDEDDSSYKFGPTMKLIELEADKKQMAENIAFGVNTGPLDRMAELGSSRLNLVTVFGPARTGKSFLLNQLVGQPDYFKVSPLHKPCTVGADISDTYSFQLGNGLPMGRTIDEDAPHVAFIDVEGMGDNGNEHFQKLVSPLFLVSQVLIFNWLGSPAAQDDILTDLGTVAFTAEKLMGGHVGGGPIFGHLHIVCRDTTDVRGVDKRLFEDEDGNSEAVLQRNTIRAILRRCFTTCRVWPLPKPVRDANALDNGDVRQNAFTKEFKVAMERLKKGLAKDVRKPRVLAQEPLTGRLLFILFPKIVQCMKECRAIDILSEVRKAVGRSVMENFFSLPFRILSFGSIQHVPVWDFVSDFTYNYLWPRNAIEGARKVFFGAKRLRPKCRNMYRTVALAVGKAAEKIVVIVTEAAEDKIAQDVGRWMDAFVKAILKLFKL